MTSYSAYPPHCLHSSRPVSQETALNLLSSYLEATTSDASLHPNALLTELGPISATSGLNTGLVLHNLRRVEAGLRGEHLGADIALAQFTEHGETDADTAMKVNVNGPGTTRTLDQENQGPEPGMGQQGWQDKSEFEREQEDNVGDIGERTQAVILSSGEDENVPRVKRTGTTGDKEARKQKKKERRKKERQQPPAKNKSKKKDF